MEPRVTPASRVATIAVVTADSVPAIRARAHDPLQWLEWLFTVLFTLEYFARLATVQRPLRYATSFFGVIDLLALLPTYIALLVPEAHALVDVRVLRLLRVFRIFKLSAYVVEYRNLVHALRSSRRKIIVFIMGVMMIPGQCTMIGFYQMCYKMHMTNNFLMLILPAIASSRFDQPARSFWAGNAAASRPRRSKIRR